MKKSYLRKLRTASQILFNVFPTSDKVSENELYTPLKLHYFSILKSLLAFTFNWKHGFFPDFNRKNVILCHKYQNQDKKWRPLSWKFGANEKFHRCVAAAIFCKTSWNEVKTLREKSLFSNVYDTLNLT